MNKNHEISLGFAVRRRAVALATVVVVSVGVQLVFDIGWWFVIALIVWKTSTFLAQPKRIVKGAHGSIEIHRVFGLTTSVQPGAMYVRTSIYPARFRVNEVVLERRIDGKFGRIKLVRTHNAKSQISGLSNKLERLGFRTA